MLRRPTALRALLFALILSIPAVSAGTAAATTGTVGPGGTLSTGSDATPDDPIQAQVTAPSGGTFSIDKVADPTRAEPDGESVPLDSYFGRRSRSRRTRHRRRG